MIKKQSPSHQNHIARNLNPCKTRRRGGEKKFKISLRIAIYPPKNLPNILQTNNTTTTKTIKTQPIPKQIKRERYKEPPLKNSSNRFKP